METVWSNKKRKKKMIEKGSSLVPVPPWHGHHMYTFMLGVQQQTPGNSRLTTLHRVAACNVLHAQGPPRLWTLRNLQDTAKKEAGTLEKHMWTNFPRQAVAALFLSLQSSHPHIRPHHAWLPSSLLRNATLHPKMVSKSLQLHKDRDLERSSWGRSMHLSSRPFHAGGQKCRWTRARAGGGGTQLTPASFQGGQRGRKPLPMLPPLALPLGPRVVNPSGESSLPKEPAQIRLPNHKTPSWNGQLLKFMQAGLKNIQRRKKKEYQTERKQSK